jgi:hypothetical protein
MTATQPNAAAVLAAASGIPKAAVRHAPAGNQEVREPTWLNVGNDDQDRSSVMQDCHVANLNAHMTKTFYERVHRRWHRSELKRRGFSNTYRPAI